VTAVEPWPRAKIANNKQLENDATEIRILAEHRLGQMLAEQKKTVGLNQGAIPGKTGIKSGPVLDSRADLGRCRHQQEPVEPGAEARCRARCGILFRSGSDDAGRAPSHDRYVVRPKLRAMFLILITIPHNSAA
jgi:hypothetical protein